MATNNATNNFGGAGGALVLIDTQVAAGVAALNFTSGITSAYNDYYMIFDSIIDVGAAGFTRIFVQLSVDGGGSYIATGYRSGAGTANGMVPGNLSDSATLGYSNGTIINATSGAGYVNSLWTNAEFVPGGGNFPSNQAGAYETPNIVVNAVRVVLSTGNTFSGTVSLYGITT